MFLLETILYVFLLLPCCCTKDLENLCNFFLFIAAVYSKRTQNCSTEFQQFNTVTRRRFQSYHLLVKLPHCQACAFISEEEEEAQIYKYFQSLKIVLTKFGKQPYTNLIEKATLNAVGSDIGVVESWTWTGVEKTTRQII
ncbi:uncharacterized protein LOC143899173 [Temnothorax americanus]|uniref:uncharacterized protein LOC143899173 n=1 Tax=Temnothorax americanus TaxID=1964332 RepID=UPI0040693734